MKMKAMQILMLMMAAILATSCVHEFPEPLPTGVVLKLSHVQDMPLYTEVHYPESRTAAVIPVRYTVWGWHIDERFNDLSNRSTITRVLSEHQPDIVENFSSGNLADPDISHSMTGLTPGVWHFIVWTEGADKNGLGLAYDDTDPENVTLVTNSGVFATRGDADCFRGEIEVEVEEETMNEITVEMNRPVGVFQFITTDILKFLDNESRRNERSSSRDIDLNDYTVTFYVNGYYPTVFDNFVNKPVDAVAGLRSLSSISYFGGDQGDLGGCMMFTNGIESSVSIIVQISDRNSVIATSAPVNVPVKRGRLTQVFGDFLTIDAGTAIGVKTEFDGEYNYPVNVSQ